MLNVATAGLAGKHVMVYFSAHWCPPCKQFTPLLAAAYKGWKDAGLPVEVVFVSSDKDGDEFSSYFRYVASLPLSLSLCLSSLCRLSLCLPLFAAPLSAASLSAESCRPEVSLCVP